MTSKSTPTPPDSLPNYLATGLPNQDVDTLRDARTFIDELLVEMEREVQVAELSDDAAVVADDAEAGGTIVEERVKCSADCTCNDGQGHGPYRYRYYRAGGTLTSEYLGKA